MFWEIPEVCINNKSLHFVKFYQKSCWIQLVCHVITNKIMTCITYKQKKYTNYKYIKYINIKIKKIKIRLSHFALHFLNTPWEERNTSLPPSSSHFPSTLLLFHHSLLKLIASFEDLSLTFGNLSKGISLFGLSPSITN